MASKSTKDGVIKLLKMENMLKLKPSEQKPWLKFFTEEAINAETPKDTIYNVIKERNKNFLGNYALNYFGNRITYGKMFKEIDKAAAAFQNLGIKKGDVVVCSTVTIPEAVYSLYALNKIGATLYVLDPRMKSETVKKALDDSKADVLIFLDLAYPLIKPVIAETNLKKVITISVQTSMPKLTRLGAKVKMPSPKIDYNDKICAWEDFVKDADTSKIKEAKYGDNDVAAISITGGTTGVPKGVMLTNDGFNAIYHNFKYCGVDCTRDHRFLNIIPIFASYGIAASLHMPLGLGLEVVVIPKFDVEKIGHYIKKYRPEHTMMAPAHYEKLANSKEISKDFDLSFFRTAGSGGDTMNEGLEQKLNNFLKSRGCKYPLSQGYGMSEVSSAASCCCNGNFKSMSVGYPLLTTTIAIFEPETTNELSYNQQGEVCITGPSIMAGYFKNQEETDNVMKVHPDGKVWVHSGDLGYIDEDGFVFIKGRIKRMITKFDGHKVFPPQIENVLGKNENVFSCAVVGVKDRQHTQGQAVLAVVQLKKGSDKEAVRQELIETLHRDVEERGVPFDVWVIDKMPRTGMDKIAYGTLSENYDKMMDEKEATAVVK